MRVRVSLQPEYLIACYSPMKRILPIIILFSLFRSGLLAQSDPSGFDLAFDKKAKEVSIVACAENGFCVVTESKSRKMHNLALVHADTSMRTVWDTVLSVPQNWQVGRVFHEDGTLILLCRHLQGKRMTDSLSVLLYHTKSRKLEARDVVLELSGDAVAADWHYYHGNLLFSTKTKSTDRVWYLPAGVNEPFQFTFTRENPGRVLSLDVDTANAMAVIVFNSGIRTMYFETDFQGKSSFANVIGEPATQAQWIPVSRNHSVLMLYFHDNENFMMHPVNILNHKVLPSDTLFCADIYVPKIEPAEAKAKRTIIVVPFNYVRFFPTYAGCMGDKIFCVTELYSLEYSNYFNGWYVEPRFEGYRYERADIHFFDTNGVFRTNLTFPYGEDSPLRTNVYKVLNVRDLPNGDVLLYHLDSRTLTTMLLDSGCKLKSPVNSVDLPMLGPVYSGRYKTVPGAMLWWYGNRFLLTAYRMNPGSQRKMGLMVRKMEYN